MPRLQDAASIDLAESPIAMVPVLLSAGYVWAADFGTPAEAASMLEKAVGETKKDKAKALEMFTKGEGGKDRDLYPYCGGPDGNVTLSLHKERSMGQGGDAGNLSVAIPC